jgi:hypothetical protein
MLANEFAPTRARARVMRPLRFRVNALTRRSQGARADNTVVLRILHFYRARKVKCLSSRAEYSAAD